MMRKFWSTVARMSPKIKASSTTDTARMMHVRFAWNASVLKRLGMRNFTAKMVTRSEMKP